MREYFGIQKLVIKAATKREIIWISFTKVHIDNNQRYRISVPLLAC